VQSGRERPGADIPCFEEKRLSEGLASLTERRNLNEFNEPQHLLAAVGKCAIPARVV
jgi:hypothetical protein